MRVEAFVRELNGPGSPFNFNDCSVGNLVFAGSFLLAGRRFNAAVDDYCALVGLPAGVIENVTDGDNAYLVAIGDDGTRPRQRRGDRRRRRARTGSGRSS